MTWCVRIGKYAANSRPLTTILPVPGRSRTRATASLRRPVVWIKGLLTRNPSRLESSCDAGLAAFGQRTHDRLLGLVRMGRAPVDLQLAQHLTTQRALREHAPHGELDDLFGVAREQVLETLAADPARVTAVAV